MAFQFSVIAEKLVASGACLTRTDEGEVVFVDGLIPGEYATVEEVKTKHKTRFASIVEITKTSDDRIEPPCEFVSKGCGGCDWQHISVESALRYKREIVVDSLKRIAKISETDGLIQDTLPMLSERYRTNARILVEGDKWGFRAKNSNEMVEVETCLVLNDECERQASDVLNSLEDFEEDVFEAKIRRAPDVYYGVALALSPKSFFQGHIDAPVFLSDLVNKFVSEIGDSLLCVDLYCGVGIFGLALASKGHQVICVEGNPYAIADAHKNLEGLNAKVVHSDVKKFRFDQMSQGKCDVVVADPSREGLTKEAIPAVLSCDAKRIVLVSCDPAAGARDIGLLVSNGYELKQVIPIDMFSHTHHLEMISILDRTSGLGDESVEN